MQAIILCGGLSTRLGDITKDTPKILLEIGNRTILDIQLELMKKAEMDQITLASGHLHQVLYEKVEESRSGVQIQYAKKKYGWELMVPSKMPCATYQRNPFSPLTEIS